jgi:hypothetical protein
MYISPLSSPIFRSNLHSAPQRRVRIRLRPPLPGPRFFGHFGESTNIPRVCGASRGVAAPETANGRRHRAKIAGNSLVSISVVPSASRTDIGRIVPGQLARGECPGSC